MSNIKDFISRVANINSRVQIGTWLLFSILSFPSIKNYMFSNIYLLTLYWFVALFAWIMFACIIFHAITLYRSAQYSVNLSLLLNILIIFMLASTIIAIIWMNILSRNNSNYNPDYGGLFGGLISGVSTLILVKFTLSIQTRDEMTRKRKSARALYSIFSTIQDQINALNHSDPSEILYDSSYLNYYYDISTSTKYDYYKILLSEINYVNRINIAIDTKNHDLLQNVISERKTYWSWIFSHEHDIYETIRSIYFFSCDMPEELPFSQSNREEIEKIAKNYRMIIENWIYNYILRNGSTEYRVIKLELVPILKEFFPETVEAERILDRAIFSVCCDFRKYDGRVNMIWNEISIK